jgi:hypothetical protein
MNKKDHETYNDPMVKESTEEFSFELSKEQLQKLIQDKFDRAKQYSEVLNFTR